MTAASVPFPGERPSSLRASLAIPISPHSAAKGRHPSEAGPRGVSDLNVATNARKSLIIYEGADYVEGCARTRCPGLILLGKVVPHEPSVGDVIAYEVRDSAFKVERLRGERNQAILETSAELEGIRPVSQRFASYDQADPVGGLRTSLAE